VATEQLASAPCYVSFSGGRDSSAVLAVATAAARRHGLPEPVPVTLRFPGMPSTDEARWQEAVVAHLELKRWEVIAIDEELDLLGAVAQRALTAHGLLWPPNTHIHDPIFALARGGVVMTGFDGDGLLGGWRWSRAQSVLHGRVRPQLRDPARVALALSPRPVRRRAMHTAYDSAAPWLRPDARRAVAEIARRRAIGEPRRWDRRVDHYLRNRYLAVTRHSLMALAATHDATVAHPLLDARFTSALARSGGRAGYGDRTATMRALFGDLLPDEVLSRRGKAEFGAAIWRSAARDFARTWDGSGVDPARVDPDGLRVAWRAASPPFGSATVLQAAWLAALALPPANC
jgi:asparagine synthetase B (glutamine-hydrolysing)